MTDFIHRIVLMRLRPEDPSALRVATAHASLSAIPGVRCVSAAQPIDVVRGHTSWTHATILQFTGQAALDDYVDHPAHTAIQPLIDECAIDVAVVQLGAGATAAPPSPRKADHDADVLAH